MEAGGDRWDRVNNDSCQRVKGHIKGGKEQQAESEHLSISYVIYNIIILMCWRNVALLLRELPARLHS